MSTQQGYFENTRILIRTNAPKYGLFGSPEFVAAKGVCVPGHV